MNPELEDTITLRLKQSAPPTCPYSGLSLSVLWTLPLSLRAPVGGFSWSG